MATTSVSKIVGSPAYQAAVAPGGIGLEAMNKNIRDFFASNPTEQQARDAMDQYLVTEEDLRRATGKGFADFFPPTGALPVASTGT